MATSRKSARPAPSGAPSRRPKAASTKQSRQRRDPGSEPEPASPAAAGPAGARLESHVGAQYLLPLLSGGEARGLPGVVVARVAFQRATLDHPMDDVIVTGIAADGQPATLEVQAKRTIDFTASDTVFADVVAFAVRAARKPAFDTQRYELAVAIARTTTKIDQHIQEVLKWARDYQEPAEFFQRLNLPRVSHRSMREFVEAFRCNMAKVDEPADDRAVWRLLRRFQVLAFDFEQAGSMCALYARERSAAMLVPLQRSRASELWDALQQIALEVDAAGGDIDASTLRVKLTSERDFRLSGDRRLHAARERLAEMADGVLSGIKLDVRGVSLDRSRYAEAAEAALGHGRYLEIRGAPGVGKSGLLKDIAQRIATESRIIVVSQSRLSGGGWVALQSLLGCDASASELLADLAGDGGGTLFIDGIDRFESPDQRATVLDLLRAAAAVKGFRVVATARIDFATEARDWLPQEALDALGQAPPLVITDLDDDEVSELRSADPALAVLLRPGHPAEKLVRNLYRLDRLARLEGADAVSPHSEAQMAAQWWRSGDGPEAGRRDRRRLLRSLAIQSLTSTSRLDVGETPGATVDALITSGALREVTAVHVEFAHDVLRDWAIGCLLQDERTHLDALPLRAPAPARLVRGLEMAARLLAEDASQADAWRSLLEQVSAADVHGSWRRSVLLALARSERAHSLLDAHMAVLFASDGAMLGELVRTAIAVDSQPAAPLWRAMGLDADQLPGNVVAPSEPSWGNLIDWSLERAAQVPAGAVPQLVDLYGRWCFAFLGNAPLSGQVVEQLYAWLRNVEAHNHPEVSGLAEAWQAAQQKSNLPMTGSQESDLRTVFLAWCRLRPSLAEAYLNAVRAHRHRHVLFRELLSFVGTAAQAAPAALADLFLDALPEGDDRHRDSAHEPFSQWHLDYFPASPARRPFLDLLSASPEHGLRLVRGVVAHAVRWRSRGRNPGDDRVAVPFPDGPREFPWLRSYTWARDQDSHVAGSALMALEAWAHQRIERGEAMAAVVADVLGPAPAPAAFLLVAIDVMLSHWPKSRDSLWPFAASAKLLALDRQRHGFDLVNSRTPDAWVHPEPKGTATLDSLRRRPSRGISLDRVLNEYGYRGPSEVRAAMQQALRAEAERIGQPDDDSQGYADPRLAAMSALNCLDLANYRESTDGDGRSVIEYVMPEAERQLVATMQAKAARESETVALRGQVSQALDQAACSQELLARGLAWAVEAPAVTGGEADDTKWDDLTRFSVATLLLRDGSVELKAAHRAWAHRQLQVAIESVRERGDPYKQLHYNPAAIAAMGLLASLRDDPGQEVLPQLLELGARPDSVMAAVLRRELDAGRQVRSEFFRSLARLGMVACTYTRLSYDDDGFGGSVVDFQARHQARQDARKADELARRQAAVALELAWLRDGAEEPKWPDLPSPTPPKPGHRIVLGEMESPDEARPRPPAPTHGFDSGGAAPWLSLAEMQWGKAHADLLGALLRQYRSWTAGANGVGANPGEEPGERPYQWNEAYFGASVVAAISRGNDDGLTEFLFQPLAHLPEERFFDAIGSALRKLDVLWLDDAAVSSTTVVEVREQLAERLVTTRAWMRLVSRPSASTETHLADAVAAFFLARHDWGRGPRCYVPSQRALGTDPVMPMLTELAEQAAGSTFVALAFMNLIDLEPRVGPVAFLARAISAWWDKHGASTEFWIDHGIGTRACTWIDQSFDKVEGVDVAHLAAHFTAMVDTLVRCGIPAAAALEARVAARLLPSPSLQR